MGGMSDPCPHCDAEPRALKNHIRLTAGNGHGPRGEYPDESPSSPDRGGDARDAGGGLALQQREEPEPRQPSPIKTEPDNDDGLVVLAEDEFEKLLEGGRGANEAEKSSTGGATALDPESAAEKADELGWGVWFGVAVVLIVAALAIGAAQARAAAERGRQGAVDLGTELGI